MAKKPAKKKAQMPKRPTMPGAPMMPGKMPPMMGPGMPKGQTKITPLMQAAAGFGKGKRGKKGK